MDEEAFGAGDDLGDLLGGQRHEAHAGSVDNRSGRASDGDLGVQDL